MNLAQYSKLIAALVGAAGEAVALGILDHQALAVGVAFLTALGVYTVPNEPADDAGQSVVLIAAVAAVVCLVLLFAFDLI